MVALTIGFAAGELALAQERPAILWSAGGHSEGLLSVAFLDDGRLLATISRDSTAKLWSMPSGRLRYTFPTGGPVCGFDAIGAIFARRIGGQRIELYEVRSGQLVQSLYPSEPASALALSPDGMRLVLSAGNGAIDVWRLQDGRIERRVIGRVPNPVELRFSPDGMWLAVRSPTMFEIWRTADWQSVFHGTGVALAFSADSSQVAVGSPRQIVLFDAASGGPAWTFSDETLLRTTALSFSPDGAVIAVAGVRAIRNWTNVIGLLQRSEPAWLREWPAHEDHDIAGLAFAPDGATLVSAGDDHHVLLWRPEDGSLAGELTAHTQPVVSVRYSHDGETIASSTLEAHGLPESRGPGNICFWRTSDGDMLRPPLEAPGLYTYDADFSPDDLSLATCGNPNLAVWTIADGTLRQVEGITVPINLVRYSPDGGAIAAAGYAPVVHVFDALTGERRARIPMPSPIHGLAYSSLGILAVSSVDRAVRLLDPSDGRIVHTLLGHVGQPLSLAFTADGQMLASCGTDGTIRLWRTADGAALHTLGGDLEELWPLVFSPDGEVLASVDGERNLRLWRTSDAELLRTFQFPAATEIYAVDWAPDNGSIALGRADGVVAAMRNPCQRSAGDVDGDCRIGLPDLAQILRSFGTCAGEPGFMPASDLDDSGCIDIGDLAIVLTNYGL